MFRTCAGDFLGILKVIWYIQIINNGSQGSPNSEIMDMLGCGLSHNEIEKLLDQNGAEYFFDIQL